MQEYREKGEGVSWRSAPGVKNVCGVRDPMFKGAQTMKCTL